MEHSFSKNKKTKKTTTEPLVNIPEHVAIIMDGNGRWAKKRGLPRVEGHKEGMNAVREITKTAVELNIKTLTLYAFSTENWKRPQSEVEFLMRLPKEFLHTYLPELIENNVKISIIGEFDTLPIYTKKAVQYAIDRTADNDGLLLNFAFNYGSRSEIIKAIKQISEDVNRGKTSINAIDETSVSKYLYTHNLSDPDLLIRTSGEQRLSNFLLWQLAYAEFWFTDVLWPDFNCDIFIEALYDYQKRIRRYGGI